MTDVLPTVVYHALAANSTAELLVNSCDGNDAKHNLGRLLMPVKRAGFILVAVQSDILSPL